MSENVRLKIPVGPRLAQQLASLAECVRQSQSWIAAQLLASVVEEQQHFAGWVYWRIAGGAVAAMDLAGEAVAPFRGRKVEAMEDTEQYVQAYVAPELADNIARIGRTMNLSGPDAASRMLYCAVESDGWMIKLINSRLVYPLLKGLGVKPSENAPGNLEPREVLSQVDGKSANETQGGQKAA